MNAYVRTFTATPAVRESVPLFINLVGPSSSGKTFSALRLATGIQSVSGGDIHVIDTENRRATHYADRFKFQHVRFDPPFGSLDYLAALEQSVKAGAKVIVVDSGSHEHDGAGGMLDAQDQELRRLAGDEYGSYKAERFNMLAWQKPKAHRRKLITNLVRLEASVIFCFRAREVSKPIKDNGKTKIVPMGFTAISGEEWIFEAALSCLLLPGSNGVPTWKSDNPGERMAIKLPEQFRSLFAESAPLSEDIGRKLAEWAKGGATTSLTNGNGAARPSDLAARAEAAAAQGMDALKGFWKSLPRPDQHTLKGNLGALKAKATAADAAPTDEVPFGDTPSDTAPTLDAARTRGRDDALAGLEIDSHPGDWPAELITAYREAHEAATKEAAL